MKNDIFATSHLLKNRITITSRDYKEIFALASPKDLIYMDPPYQGVCHNRDPRYIEGVNHDQLIEELNELNKRKISYILSYDGRCGAITYGTSIPDWLHLHKLEIKAGRSSQSTLLGGKDYTYESLYLSEALVDRLPFSTDEIMNNFNSHAQHVSPSSL